MAELLDAWLTWRQTAGKSISPLTVNDYRGLIERKLKPGLGKLRLAQLDTQRLDRFYGELRKTGNAGNGGGALSESRVRDVHAIVSGALGLAARYGWIAFNPALLARPPAQQSVTRTVPTAGEVRELLAAAAADPDLELYLRLAATTGLRPGKLCALRWVDLDLEAAEARVTGNVVQLEPTRAPRSPLPGGALGQFQPEHRIAARHDHQEGVGEQGQGHPSGTRGASSGPGAHPGRIALTRRAPRRATGCFRPGPVSRHGARHCRRSPPAGDRSRGRRGEPGSRRGRPPRA